MSLGYNVEEDNRDFEKEGITGQVSRFSSQNMEYPCYVLNNTPECPVEEYKAEALKGMLNQVNLNTDGEFKVDTIQPIIIYMDFNGSRFRLGSITPSQVKSFLTSFENNEIIGYMNETIKLEGQNLYVLAS